MKRGKPAVAAAGDVDTNPQTQSLLFTLPAELRNYVYTLVLQVDTLPAHTTLSKQRNRDPPSVLAMLESCRLIESEARGIFYSMNHFQIDFSGPQPLSASARAKTFPNTNSLTDFVDDLRRERLSAIRELTIIIADIESATSTLKMLRCCDGLKQMFLVVETPVVQGSMTSSTMVLQSRHEPPFIRKAMASLPTSVESISFDLVLLQGGPRRFLGREEMGGQAKELEADMKEMFATALEAVKARRRQDDEEPSRPEAATPS